MDRISISQWIDEFQAGTFNSDAVRTQVIAGWYDWFCKDSSLVRKTAKLGRIIAKIKAGGKVDLQNWYVWFKNNCPLNGPLYDDFRFADLETGSVQFTIQVNCCWNTHRFAVYGRTPDGESHWDKPLFETDSAPELINWFNSPWTI